MNKIAKDVMRLAESVMSADTFKCPSCDTKVLKQTGFCVKCKKKVKEGARGIPAIMNSLGVSIQMFEGGDGSEEDVKDLIHNLEGAIKELKKLKFSSERRAFNEAFIKKTYKTSDGSKIPSGLNMRTFKLGKGGDGATVETKDGKEIKLVKAAMSDDPWFTVEHVRGMCASCADKMERRGLSKIRKSAFLKAVGMDKYGKMTWEECISEAKKTGKTDPDKFCGWLYWHGPNARG